MIYKGQPKTNEIKEFDDLRKVSANLQKRYGSFYHVHKVPTLPSFTDKTYHYKDVEMNLFNLTCTCDSYNDKLLLQHEQRDIRCLCVHLYYKLISSAAKRYIDQLTLILMEAAVKHNAQYFYKYSFLKEKKDVYFSFSEHTDWINVYLQVRSDEDADYVRFGYSYKQHRWNYDEAPAFASKIEYIAESIIKNQLPYEYK